MSGQRPALALLLALFLVAAGGQQAWAQQDKVEQKGLLTLFVPIFNLFRGTVRLTQDLVIRAAATSDTAAPGTVVTTNIFSDGDITISLISDGTAAPVEGRLVVNVRGRTGVTYIAQSSFGAATVPITPGTPVTLVTNNFAAPSSFPGIGIFVSSSDGRVVFIPVVVLVNTAAALPATTITTTAFGTLSYTGPSPPAVLTNFWSFIFSFFSAPGATAPVAARP